MRIQIVFIDGLPWKAKNLDSPHTKDGRRIFRRLNGIYYFRMDGTTFDLGISPKEFMEVFDPI